MNQKILDKIKEISVRIAEHKAMAYFHHEKYREYNDLVYEKERELKHLQDALNESVK